MKFWHLLLIPIWPFVHLMRMVPKHFRSGRYEIDYTLPAASHLDEYFSDILSLTADQALRFDMATRAKTIFLSGYVDPAHNATAKELAAMLNKEYPQYCHPVGVILGMRRVDQMKDQHHD